MGDAGGSTSRVKWGQLEGGRTGLAEGAGKTHSALGVEPSQRGGQNRGQGVLQGQGTGRGGVQAALSQGAKRRMGQAFRVLAWNGSSLSLSAWEWPGEDGGSIFSRNEWRALWPQHGDSRKCTGLGVRTERLRGCVALW